MYRISSVCLLIAIVFCLATCKKSEIYGPVQYRAQAIADDKIIAEYLAKYDTLKQFKHAQNNDTLGVYYRIIDSGATNTLYTSSTQITVGDTGRLVTLAARQGQLFYQTDQFHPTYSLGAVITGWQYGIPEVGAGGEIELIMASRYAYGHYAQPQVGQEYGLTKGLPANAILDFYIRVYAVTN